MNSLDAITLKAFLTALMRLDNSLSAEVQNQLNQRAETFPVNVSTLHELAKIYSPLEHEYMEARVALQDDGERLRFVAPNDNSIQVNEQQILNFALEVLQSQDSVNLAKKKAQESSELGQLLFELERRTSFMVKHPYTTLEDVPQEEQWLWQDPTAWADLERGLRQAQAGKGRSLGSFAQYADLEIDD